jgi:hypothetical protein
MTSIYPDFDTLLVTLLVGWLQARYAHKLERYAAMHASVYVLLPRSGSPCSR